MRRYGLWETICCTSLHGTRMPLLYLPAPTKMSFDLKNPLRALSLDDHLSIPALSRLQFLLPLYDLYFFCFLTFLSGGHTQSFSEVTPGFVLIIPSRSQRSTRKLSWQFLQILCNTRYQTSVCCVQSKCLTPLPSCWVLYLLLSGIIFRTSYFGPAFCVLWFLGMLYPNSFHFIYEEA